MKRKLMMFLLCFVMAFQSAGCQETPKEQKAVQSEQENEEIEELPKYYKSGEKFVPEATGTKVKKNEDVLYDYSNTDQGYLMIEKKTNADKILIQVTGQDMVTYNYYIKEKNKYCTIPLTAGDGEYQVTTYVSVEQEQYMMSLDETIPVKLENEVIPFLYPSQYVDFNDTMNAIKLADKLTKNRDELAAASSVYDYVIKHITYDYDKAATVQSGYLPVIDRTLKEKKGICFDYAALMTAMLRSQGIPTKLDIGYTMDMYHAWISIFISEKGWVSNVVEFDGKNWNFMDPTMAASDKDSSEEYIMDASKYNLEYTH